MAKDPFKNSPYDASGMPLGAETADYDNFADVAQKMVRDRVPTHPKSINDIDYEEEKLELPVITEKGFNSAIADDVNSAYPIFEAVDMQDTGEKRKLYVKEAEAEGYTSVAELPKMESQEKVEEIKKEIRDEGEDTSFLDDETEGDGKHK